MPIVKVDGKRIKFPDDMSSDKIRDVLKFYKQSQPEKVDVVKEFKVASEQSKKAMEKAAKDIVRSGEAQTRAICASQENAIKSVSSDIQGASVGIIQEIGTVMASLKRPDIKSFSVRTPEGRRYEVDLRCE